jgi:hypothetical protein
MRAVDGKWGGGAVVTRGGTRMAPAPAGSGESARRTFAVGRLTWGRSELRVVEPRRLEARRLVGWEPDAAKTVH